MFRRSAIFTLLMVGVISRASAQTPQASASTDASGIKTFTVPSGTKILLTLKNEISTRVAAPGDSAYFVSVFPVVENGAVVLPAGMYVKGYIDHVQRPGKIKGRAQLQMHFGSIILPNGVEIALPGSLDKVPGSSGSQVKNSEGTVEQGSSVGHDAKQITGTTLEGAGVGGLAGVGGGNAGMAAGIGAGAGATIGVLTTLLTRGNDIVFPPGTTVEMVLNRPLEVKQSQLAGMPSYTGVIAPVGLEQSPVITPAPHN